MHIGLLFIFIFIDLSTNSPYHLLFTKRVMRRSRFGHHKIFSFGQSTWAELAVARSWVPRARVSCLSSRVCVSLSLSLLRWECCSGRALQDFLMWCNLWTLERGFGNGGVGVSPLLQQQKQRSEWIPARREWDSEAKAGDPHESVGPWQTANGERLLRGGCPFHYLFRKLCVDNFFFPVLF